MIGLLLVAALLVAAPQQDDPALSRRLFHEALDRQADLDEDSALVLFRAARDADLANVDAHYTYVHKAIGRLPHPMTQLRAEYDSLRDSPEVRCFRAYLAVSPENLPAAYPSLVALQESGRGGPCPPVLLARVTGDMKPEHKWEDIHRDYVEKAVASVPALEDAQAAYAAMLAGFGRTEEAEFYLRRAAADASTHPITRLRHDLRRAALILGRGDTVAAEALWMAVAAAMERDGRPGLRLVYLRELDAFVGTSNTPGSPFDEVLREQAELARAHGEWEYEWSGRYTLAMRLTDRGEPLAALGHYDRVVALSDSISIPRRQVQAYYKRGRALRSLGRLESAESDLLRAVVLGRDIESPYYRAEAYHNLFHFYDDSGRASEAGDAVNRFADAVAPLRHSPIRMTAWLDVAGFRWKQGWHAAAREAFLEAVSVVDEYDEYHNYAGAYFERVGDLELARRYYQRGVEAGGLAAEGVRSASLGGLTRVLLATGQVDSAAVVARKHDAAISGPTATPLLPEILMQKGERNEAIQMAEDWVQHRRAGGAARSRCAANLYLAELLIQAGDPTGALQPLDRADSLASQMSLVEEQTKSLHLRGLALAASSDTSAALDLLYRAAGRAADLAQPSMVRESHAALGDLQTALGRLDEALVSYEMAARQVEVTTVSFEVDFDRVRYRDRNLSPYDGAIRALLAAPDGARRNADLLLWSARRKAAALAVATSGLAELTAEPSRTVRPVPAAGHVFVDYVTSDSGVAALVVDSAGISVRVLPITAGEVARLVERLRDPLTASTAGQIDLARAPFDVAAARALYDGLWRPLSAELDTESKVSISPDGPIHLVPFAALISGDDGSTPRFVIDDHELGYVLSARWLTGREPRPWTIEEKRLLAVAFDAPGAGEEVASISRAWPGETTVLSGDGATESAVGGIESEYDILHYAAHAVADDRDPLASNIRLRPDTDSDGLYHLSEISSRRHQQELVVLSGCETQMGRSYAGEGLMSLTRAFLGSGAHAVVATQWPVGPATVPLMTEFYRGLARGEDPGAALREAQLSLRTDPRTAHPFYWGGFVLHRRD
jgi:CHAT domain-containing protein